jgi:cephalosporin-C deacetylase-like acetyl esterase
MSNGIYTSPGPLPVTLTIANNSGRKCSLKLEYTLKKDLFGDDSVIDIIKAHVRVDRNSDVRKTASFNPPGPGFYKVTCAVTDSKDRSVEKSMFLGYDPEEIETELTREGDFESFWNDRRRELKDVEPRFKVTESDRSSEDLDVYLVEMRSHGDVRVRGWYTVPTGPGLHPAILSVPGYNSTMWPNMRRKNVATFALNPRGHGNSKDDVDAKGGEYMYLSFDPNRSDKYIYVGAYMDCVRAVDFLASRPEIDKSRIGVEGGSQGGGLSFATAALDPRIAFCAPDIPWLGDWVGYVAASDWPHEHYPELIEDFPGLTYAEINRVLSYVDTMNLAGRTRCPVLMSIGLQDAVCPPRNSFATYNLRPTTGCDQRKSIAFTRSPVTASGASTMISRINGWPESWALRSSRLKQTHSQSTSSRSMSSSVFPFVSGRRLSITKKPIAQIPPYVQNAP